MEKKMKLVRLSSGEEVIGKVTENKDTITIKDGYMLSAVGEGKIGFIPFMAYTKAKDGVEVNKTFVMFMVDPIDSIIDQIRTMNSGIVTPEKGIITQ
tara:strand:+ start:978 stop:1268 length:291 start_codon:yes stop_codon:yes gene_type:complete